MSFGWNISVLVFVLLAGISSAVPNRQCHPVEIPECRRLGYNMTRNIPGLYLRTRLSEIKSYITFLDRTNCSSDLLFFLCTMYSPMCFTGYDRIYPCRSVCLDVKKKCAKILNLLDEVWPAELACSKLPEHSTDMCIRPNAIIARKDHSRNSTPDDKTTPKPPTPASCPPCKRDKRKIKYKQYERADYVIKAVFRRRVTTATGETKILIEIKDRLKRGSFRVKRGKYYLISRSKCLCNPMNLDETYFIMGRESRQDKTLLFNKRTIIKPATPRWTMKFAKWKKRSRAERHRGNTNKLETKSSRGNHRKSG